MNKNNCNWLCSCFDLLKFQNISFKIFQSIWITFPFFHILRIASVLQFVYGLCSVCLLICLFFSVPLQNTLPHKYIITVGYKLQNISVGLAPSALSKEGFLSHNTHFTCSCDSLLALIALIVLWFECNSKILVHWSY